VVHCGSGSQQPDLEPAGMSDEEREILAVYHKSFNDDDVDYNLIKAIIQFIQSQFKVSADLCGVGVDWDQGDQIGRVFAYRVTVFFG
jgi:hypothetical protein